jgi:hypothetical protein
VSASQWIYLKKKIGKHLGLVLKDPPYRLCTLAGRRIFLFKMVQYWTAIVLESGVSFQLFKAWSFTPEVA